MADLKPTLTAALKNPKPIFFTFVANGAGSRLLADKKKISTKETADAKKEAGGGTIFQGRCKGENGTLVFEVAKEPPGTLAALIKKIVKQDAALTCPVEVRVAAAVANEGEGEDGADAAGTPPSEDSAAVTMKLNALAPDIKAALAGPNQARVQTLLGAVKGQIANKDFAQAEKNLEELAALIKSEPAPPPAPSAPGKPPPPPSAPKAPPVSPKAPPAQASAASAKPAAAKPAPAPKAPPPAPPQDPQEAEWERRVMALEPRVLEAQKKRAGEQKWMTLFMSVQDLGSEGNFAKALDVLNRLEGLLNEPPPKTSPALEAALAKWTTARATTIGSLKELEGRIRAMNDPDGDGAIILVKSIQANLPARPATMKTVADLERYINTDWVITEAETPNGFGIEIAIRSSLLPALAAVRASLPA